MTDVPATTPSETLGYTLWAVFRRDPSRPAPAGDLTAAVAEVEASGVVVRGFYDVSGMRADADLMVWLHGSTDEHGVSTAPETRKPVSTQVVQAVLAPNSSWNVPSAGKTIVCWRENAAPASVRMPSVTLWCWRLGSTAGPARRGRAACT